MGRVDIEQLQKRLKMADNAGWFKADKRGLEMAEEGRADGEQEGRQRNGTARTQNFQQARPKSSGPSMGMHKIVPGTADRTH